jgi:hypothetical protein
MNLSTLEAEVRDVAEPTPSDSVAEWVSALGLNPLGNRKTEPA